MKYSELLASDKLHTICIKRLPRCLQTSGWVRPLTQTNKHGRHVHIYFLKPDYFINEFLFTHANFIYAFEPSVLVFKESVRLSWHMFTFKGCYAKETNFRYWYWYCISTDFKKPKL